MFISFEGIDGCGKSTHIKLLHSYLKDIGKECLILREPGGTQFSEEIRQLLLSHKFNIDPVTELLLFEAARANLTNTIIKPAMKNGKIILLDRFFDSTTAYQGFGRGIDIDIISKLNFLATDGIKPDITFFLDIPIEISNLRARNKQKDRIEVSGNDFFSNVVSGFHQIAEENPDRVFIIKSGGNINDTFQHILNILVSKYQGIFLR